MSTICGSGGTAAHATNTNASRNKQRNDCEEEDILLTSSSSRWRRVREAGQSAGSLSLTRWCSDLVTWDEDDFYDKDEEDFYNSHDEVNDFLLNDLTEQELKRQK